MQELEKNKKEIACQVVECSGINECSGIKSNFGVQRTCQVLKHKYPLYHQDKS